MIRPLLIVGYLILLIAPVSSQDLRVAFGTSRPPFIDQDTASGTVIDLFRKCLEEMGIKGFSPVFASNARLDDLIVKRRVDVAVEVQPGLPGVFYSDVFIEYKNWFIVQKESSLTIKTWDDLTGLTVCAWQNARMNLGTNFASHTSNMARYVEYPQQKDQVWAWMHGRFQVIIVDDQVFEYHLKSLAPRMEARWEIPEVIKTPLPEMHTLPWYVGFQDPDLRDRFNTALKKVRNQVSNLPTLQNPDPHRSSSPSGSGLPH